MTPAILLLLLNPLEEYFEEGDISKLEGEPLEEPPRKQLEKTITPPKKKSNSQEGKSWKKAW